MGTGGVRCCLCGEYLPRPTRNQFLLRLAKALVQPYRAVAVLRQHRIISTIIFTVALTLADAARATETSSISCIAPVSQGHGDIDTGGVGQMVEIPSLGVLIAAGKGFFRAYSDNGEVAVKRIGNINISGLSNFIPFPGIGILAITRSGNFWAHAADGRIVIDNLRIPPLSSKFRTIPNIRFIKLPGNAGIYVGTLGTLARGLWVRQVGGNAIIKRIMTPTLSIRGKPEYTEYSGFHVNQIEIATIPGAGVLAHLYEADTLLWAGIENGGLRINPEALQTGSVVQLTPLSDSGALLWTKGHPWTMDDDDLFYIHAENGKIIRERVERISPGSVSRMILIPNIGILIRTSDELSGKTRYFLVRPFKDKLRITKLDTNDGVFLSGRVTNIFTVPDSGTLISTYLNLYWLSFDDQSLVNFFRRSIFRPVYDIVTLAGAGTLIGNHKGLFWVQYTDQKPDEDRIRADTIEHVTNIIRMPGLGALIVTNKNELFFARIKNSKLSITHLSNVGISDDLARIDSNEVIIKDAGNLNISDGYIQVTNIPGVGAILDTLDGIFFVDVKNRRPTLQYAANLSNAYIAGAVHVADATTLIGTSKGLFAPLRVPLESVDVRFVNSESFAHVTADLAHARVLRFTIKRFPCLSVLRQTGIALKLTGYGGQYRLIEDPAHIQTIWKSGNAKIAITTKFKRPGIWTLQLATNYKGKMRLIGEPFTVQAISPERPINKFWIYAKKVIIAAAAAAFIIIVLLLVAARWSQLAWQIATARSWRLVLIGLPVVLLGILERLPCFQLWILCLYFRNQKMALQPNSPLYSREEFLPLPVTSEGHEKDSDKIIAPKWKDRHCWIQGNVGMGKTTIFMYMRMAHFSDCKTAFEARRRYGSVLVGFEARHFEARHFKVNNAGQENYNWVLEAIRQTLAGSGLACDGYSFIKNCLRSGTVAVVIDGAHEIQDRQSIEAFSREFSNAPIFITSQNKPGSRFDVWELPNDIGRYTYALLRKYLTAQETEELWRSISASKLKDDLRSGYDVRLLADLARNSEDLSALPRNRLQLYKEIIDAAWPSDVECRVIKQKRQMAAAAWRMISERGPHEDTRQIKPDDGLSEDLLRVLAEAPETDQTSVRLIRPAGKDRYEFVQDQMHLYLAAWWFTWDGTTAAQQIEMIDGSVLWRHDNETKRTLWDFVSQMLSDEQLVDLRARIETQDAEKLELWNLLLIALIAECRGRGS